MLKILLWVGLPSLGAAGAFFLKPSVFWEPGTFSAGIAWTFVGVFLSYLGVVFSAYALHEVRILTHRNFAKHRFPELQSQIEKVWGRMKELKAHTVADARTETFLGEAEVALKRLKQAPTAGFAGTVKRARKQIVNLKSVFRDPKNKELVLQDVTSFWELYQALSEVTDEIRAFNQDSKARL